MTIIRPVAQIAFALWQQQPKARWLPVTGHSMLPLLRTGDLVLVVPAVAYQLGDIVLFRKDANLLVHRLVATQHSIQSHAGGQTPTSTSLRWVTQGDNCREPDPPVAMAQMIGKVVAVQRIGATCSLVGRHWRVCNRLLILLGVQRHRRWLQRLLLRLMARYLRWRLRR